MPGYWGYWEGLAINAGINVVAVLGVTVILGFTGLFTFGHAAYMAIGGYVSALVSLRLGCPVPLAIILGSGAAALLSIPIGYPTLRLKGDYFVVGTLGAGEVVRLLLENLDWITGGARGLPEIPVRYVSLGTVLALDVFIIWVVRNFVTSKYGRQCVAIRENELAAECMAIDPFRSKITALMLGSAFAGLAGALQAHYFGVLSPNMFNINRSADLTIMVILGGMGSVTGSVLAAVVLTLLPELLRSVAEWRLVTYGMAVILVMLCRPAGLLGHRELTPETIRQAFISRRSPTDSQTAG